MSTQYNNLITELNEGILTVIISRPKSLNALNFETMSELDTILNDIYADEEIKGIIITGSGEKSFVAGADINELSNLDSESGKKFSQNGQRVFSKIEKSRKPVIAAVNGYALGGGCEIAMACHIRIATKTAIFGLPEVNLGVIPGYGGTQRLTKLVGPGMAIEMMATGEHIRAEEAYRVGLVNHLAETQVELMEISNKIMKSILNKAPFAVSMVLDSVDAFYDQENGYEHEAENFSSCINTVDFQEGTKAFLEKRKPQFKGK